MATRESKDTKLFIMPAVPKTTHSRICADQRPICHAAAVRRLITFREITIACVVLVFGTALISALLLPIRVSDLGSTDVNSGERFGKIEYCD